VVLRLIFLIVCITILFAARPLLPMVHSETPFPVLIIRENEFGHYDTLRDSARTVFDFDNKFVVDGRNYLKPKYNVITGGN
jgi:hypothetical protein